MTDHTGMVCTMGVGVGGRLSWSVTIGNQSSANPRTSYRRPVITGMAVRLVGSTATTTSTAALHNLTTAGGDMLVFFGEYFGPSTTPVVATGRWGVCGVDAKESLLPWLYLILSLSLFLMLFVILSFLLFECHVIISCIVESPALDISHSSWTCTRAIAFARSAFGTLTSTACTSLSDTEVHCVSPSGIGTDYTWVLTVAGQSSLSSPTSTSYGVAIITAVTTSQSAHGVFVVPTLGGSTVTVSGSNLPESSADVAVLWNDVAVTTVVVSVPFQQLRFTSLEGEWTHSRG